MKPKRRPARSVPFRFVVSALLGVALLGATGARAGAAARSGRRTSHAGSAPVGVDMKHVALDLRLDWAERGARGTALLTLAPLAPARRVALDAGRLAIEAITLADGRPLVFDYDGGDRDGGLVVRLDRRYRAGEELTLLCRYATRHRNASDPNSLSGSDGQGLRVFGPTTTEPLKRRQAWTMGWPTGNRYWFPGHDAPDDLRTQEITLTVEPPLTAVSNGRLVETRTNPDGTRSFHWRVDRPCANHLASFVVGEYQDVPREADGLTLHSYGYPDEVDAVAASVERLPDMLRYFTAATGAPFPFEGYAQVFVQDLPWGFGQAGQATLTENMIDDARTHAEWRYLWDGLAAETLAHQWFGGLLSPRDWRHAWLDRGFARFFDGLYNERTNGRDEYLLWQHGGDLATGLADWQAGVRHPVVPARAAEGRQFASDNYPIFRGALVLHLLRAHLGEVTWQAALRGYVAAHAGGTVTTADFQRAVETAAGQPMGWFFDQWVYRMGHPVFEIGQRYDAARGRLTLTVRQAQRPDPKAAYPTTRFFRGPVDVEIDGDVVRVELAPRERNVFTFDRPARPRLVHFDYESAWPKEMTFEKTTADLIYQLGHDRDPLGRRWAMGELVKRGRLATATAEEKAAIVAGFRQVIGGGDYWRLRTTALSQLRALLTPANPAEPLALDDSTRATLEAVARRETSWVRASALGCLGLTRDPRYADLYLEAFREDSHQVCYAAAGALGKSGSPRAFDALTGLMALPSWKGENRLSGLLGLRELRDPRGFDAAWAALADTTTRRWTLATPLWDFRLAGAETMAALGRGADGYPLVCARLERALAEDDINDVFSNALLLATLADPRAQAQFDLLRARYREDANALAALDGFEGQFKAALARP